MKKGQFKQNKHNIKTGEVFVFDNGMVKSGFLKSAPIEVVEVVSQGVFAKLLQRKIFYPFASFNNSIENALIERI